MNLTPIYIDKCEKCGEKIVGVFLIPEQERLFQKCQNCKTEYPVRIKEFEDKE
jgi:hypothetical protein